MENPELLRKLIAMKLDFPNMRWSCVEDINGDPRLTIHISVSRENQDFLISAQKMFEPADYTPTI